MLSSWRSRSPTQIVIILCYSPRSRALSSELCICLESALLSSPGFVVSFVLETMEWWLSLIGGLSHLHLFFPVIMTQQSSLMAIVSRFRVDVFLVCRTPAIAPRSRALSSELCIFLESALFSSPGFVCECDWVGSKGFNPESAILLCCLWSSVHCGSIRRLHPPYTPIVHSICSVCRWNMQGV